MLSTGPRSYYDDYLRKKNTGRVVEDPTALLTDRNAYVNFLEVQLERVSAACLAVQSTEERFSDLTGMIQTLEQRCTANIKLVGLAQQCTEQVRAEGDRKFEILLKQQEDDRQAFDRAVRQLAIQLTQQERKLSQYEPLQERVLQCERDISDLNSKLSATKELLEKVENEKNQLQVSLQEEQENSKRLEKQFALSISSNQQKLLTMLDEHRHEQSQMYQQSVDRFQELFNVQQESLIEAQQSHRRTVDDTMQKQNDHIEEIQMDFVTRMNTHYGDLSQEMAYMKETIQDNIRISIVQSVESSMELKESMKSIINQQVNEIRSELFSDMEERVATESQRVLEEYIYLTQNGDDMNASVVYPGAPTPSIANSMDPSMFGMMRSGSLDELDNKSSKRTGGLSRSASAFSQIKRVPSNMSDKSQESKGIKDTSKKGRLELDAIHSTLQALLEMHRQDILSIHHRLDAMQIPLGVAPAKPLSRRNSVVGNNTNANDMLRMASMQSMDTNISALTIKSMLSASSKGSRNSKSSKSSKGSGQSKKLKEQEDSKDAVTAISGDEEAPVKEARRKVVKKKKVSQPSVLADEKSTVSKKQLSFMEEKPSSKGKKSAEKSSVSKKQAKNSTGGAILNLSDDDLSDDDSDYEDIAVPYDLSASMSFISNKSRLSSKPKVTSPTIKRNSSFIRPTQASLQRHPGSATQTGTLPVPTVRRKQATVVASMPVVRSHSAMGRPRPLNSSNLNSSTLNSSMEDYSAAARTRRTWRLNNTYVTPATTSATKNHNSSSNHTHSHPHPGKITHGGCEDCGGFHPSKRGTTSIKDTVLSVDGCCRYCGKDLLHLDHRNVDSVRVKIPSVST